MEENKKSSADSPETSKWIRRDDSAEVYSNQFFLNWSIQDIRLRFGSMIPTDKVLGGNVGYIIEENAAISMAWPQAKALRDSLNDAVARYEKTNGVIDLSKLRLPE